MSIFSILAIEAGVLCIMFLVFTSVWKRELGKNKWMIPAFFSFLFFSFSVFTGLQEGPTGFWPEHTKHFWGNQIWFDLLLAASVAWVLLIPRAKAVGMKLLFWGVLVVATGSIGVLAMFSRVLYLESRR